MAALFMYRTHITFPPGSGPLVRLVFGIAWLLITASWACFLCVSWFHPEKGALRRRPSTGRLVQHLISAARLAAFVLLTLLLLNVPAPLIWLL